MYNLVLSLKIEQTMCMFLIQCCKLYKTTCLDINVIVECYSTKLLLNVRLGLSKHVKIIISLS